MNEQLVTIVLPIYNVEPYLDRCIQSVIAQTYTNLEILLIDDGSLDGCPQKCDEWAKRDKRIRTIHKHNEGLGMARNTGIENATGEYIFFFDSDDFVEPDIVECCVRAKNETGAETVVYGYEVLDRKGRNTKQCLPILPKNIIRGEEVKEIVVPCLTGPVLKDGKIYNIAPSAWSLMYSAKLIKSREFKFISEREIISEDLYSNLIYYSYVDSIAVVNKALYHYCYNNRSLSRAYNPNRFSSNKHFYLETIKLCDELGYTELTKRTLSSQMLANTIATIKQTVCSSLTFKEKRKIIKKIVSDEITKKALNDYNFSVEDKFFRKILLFCMKKQSVNIIFSLIALKQICKR